MTVVNFRACYKLTETLIIYYIIDSDVDRQDCVSLRIQSPTLGHHQKKSAREVIKCEREVKSMKIKL